MKEQRGVTLVGMIVVCIVIGVVALLGLKVGPDVIEYYSILKNVKATAQDPSSKGASVAEIQRNFEKRAYIDNVKSINGADLDVSKEGADVVISFEYASKIHLFGPVSLLINFEGSSAQ